MRIQTAAASLSIAVGAAFFAASPLQAQTAGTYTGTSADGQSLSFTVGTDSSDALAIISVSTSVNALCPDGSPFPFGSGYGQDVVINDGAVDYTEYYAYLWQKVTGHFVGNTFVGHIISITPYLLLSPTGLPRTAEACKSANQTFTTTLEAADAAVRKPEPNRTYTYHP